MKISFKAKGFTLIELMIVVAILATLAAIAIPKFTLIVEKSREAATKGNLGAIKSAISLYYGNNNGLWPSTLQTGLNNYLSEYLTEMPSVQVTGIFIPNPVSPAGCNVINTIINGSPSACGQGWLYDSNAGHVFVNSTIHDSNDMAYSFYGFE